MTDKRWALFTTIAVAGFLAAAIGFATFLMITHHGPRSTIDRVIKDPLANLSSSHIDRLQEFFSDHYINDNAKRGRFCKAVMERAANGKNDLLWLVVLPEWKESRKFECVWAVASERISACASGSGSILMSLADADKRRAAQIVDYNKVLLDCNNEKLLVGCIMIMDSESLRVNREAVKKFVGRRNAPQSAVSLAREKLGYRGNRKSKPTTKQE